MNMNTKVDYTSPMCSVTDLCLSGILCASGDKFFSNEEFEGVMEYGKEGWI